ncbi:MAG: ATP-binding protein [Bifidobacteriaceae bacterium]|jgi:predicted ATPase|nr:ATP-binding protein [Bifidobacteriaceae bacterium]
MHLRRLTLQNFRSFRGKHTFEFFPGLNCIVGDNNCGKSSVFEAITYLMGIGRVADTLTCNDADDAMRVEADIAGDNLAQVLGDDKYKKLRDFVFDVDGVSTLRVERSPLQRSVKQSGKDVQLDGKKLPVWNPATQQFENPTGIDALIKGLIDFEPVWADTVLGDVADFGTTKILGKIIDAQVKGFQETVIWQTFLQAHRAAFAGGGESLAVLMDTIAEQIAAVVRNQYGEAQVRFDFAPPDAATLVKGGQLFVDDGAGETNLTIKGTGMQRAFALALIQVLAQVNRGGRESGTPLILLIDEPETWLHPRAQLQLGEALTTIAKTDQLFLITHSPYLLRHYDAESHRVIVFVGKGVDAEVSVQEAMGVSRTGRPSWGEINYRAFGIPSDEFLDELYSLAQDHATSANQHVGDLLLQQGLQKWKTRRWKGQDHQVTRPEYVRHSIHHPGTANAPHTPTDLADAITDLMGVVDRLRPLREVPEAN